MEHFLVWTCLPNRPCLHQEYFLNSIMRLDLSNWFSDSEISLGINGFHDSDDFWGNHDFIFNGGCFLYYTKDITAGNLGTFRNYWFKLPFFFAIDCRNLDALFNPWTNFFCNQRERSLNSIENLSHKPGTKLHRQ